ncbi:MAG: death-on-curing family protein [Pseudonocardiales bacterium]|nr:death-on-curing family protein [Pseudonocardiales bacterium]
MIYLTYAELLYIAERALGGAAMLRDAGLLESAAARPQTSVFGEDAYPTLEDKAAALTHSLARNHSLVDGNKRLALAGLIAFLGVNGRRLTLTNNDAYDLIIAIATGDLSEISDIAQRIRKATTNRS